MPTMTDTDSILLAVAAFLFAFAVIALIAWAFKTFMLTGRSGSGFLKGRERRLGVVESAAVDGHRKLILIRRDNVEHLIMTGGPVDVVIETGIEGHRHLEPPLEDVVIARTEPRPMPDLGKACVSNCGKPRIPQHERPKLGLDCDTLATVVLLVRQAQLR